MTANTLSTKKKKIATLRVTDRAIIFWETLDGKLRHTGSSSMSQPREARRLVSFGTFEADLVTRELRKNGAKIRLQDQPFQVLALLLENPEQAVTREKFRQKLWSTDTFVDFDNGLNTAINKIRDALGDSAENPRFVEILPRRGYRFIAPVQSPPTRPLETGSAIDSLAVLPFENASADPETNYLRDGIASLA